jgi:hypothetical protein
LRAGQIAAALYQVDQASSGFEDFLNLALEPVSAIGA